jgi:hypothetical protein
MRKLCLFLVVSIAACSSVRSGYRTLRNEEREGSKAPELDLAGVDWVNGSEADLSKSAGWTLFAFFKPT